MLERNYFKIHSAVFFKVLDIRYFLFLNELPFALDR